MSTLFHVYASQECQQATDQVFNYLSDLETVFPQSLFLKTQRALLEYHQKGQYYHFRIHKIQLCPTL